MSRVGKQIIEIPAGTEVSVNGTEVTVKSSKGELKRTFRDEVEVKVEDGKVTFEQKKDTPFSKAMWGTVASHVSNMVQGVNEGFEKQLIVEGIGYKADVSGNVIKMALGFSHPIEMEIPEGLEVTSEKNVITVKGMDKEKVGLFASTIRLKKKPEPYKRKGIRYSDETIIRKEGKKAA